MFQHVFAKCCQAGLTGRAFDQRPTHDCFQLFDLYGKRGLRYRTGRSRFAKVAVRGERLE